MHREACAAHGWLETARNTHGSRLIGEAADGLLLCSFMSKDLRACSPLLSQVALTLSKCLMSLKCLRGIRIKHPSQPPAPLGARHCKDHVETQMSCYPLRGDKRHPWAQHPCISASPCPPEQCYLMMTGSCDTNKPSVKVSGDSKNICTKR